MQFERMFPHEVRTALEQVPMVYLPLGPLEFHGAHLAYGLDPLKAHAICLEACRQTGGIVMPPLYASANTLPVSPYTIDTPLEVLRLMVRSLLAELARYGCQVAVLHSGHGAMDHNLMLKQEADYALSHFGLRVLAFIEWEFVPDLGYLGEHAAKWETSLLWASHPDLVDMPRLGQGPLATLEGVYGEDPRTTASPELGRRTTAVIAERMAAEIGRVLAGALPENQERHRRWVEAAWPEPLEYQAGSLIRTETGIRFRFYNPHMRSRYITAAVLEIDGRQVPAEQISLTNPLEERTAAVSGLHGLAGMYVRRTQSLEVDVRAVSLSPGRHALSLRLELGGVMESVVQGEEVLAQ